MKQKVDRVGDMGQVEKSLHRQSEPIPKKLILMKKSKFGQDVSASGAALKPKWYKAGEEYSVRLPLAEAFLEGGYAVDAAVRQEKPKSKLSGRSKLGGAAENKAVKS